MNIINNSTRESSIRIEVVRAEKLNKLETALCHLMAEMLSALLTDKDDNMVSICGQGCSQVSDMINKAMLVREQVGFQKVHQPHKKLNLDGMKDSSGAEDEGNNDDNEVA